MTSVYLATTPKQRYVDNNGNGLAGGQLYTYAAGTSTPQATYTDASGSTPNANPIALDARGECSMWLDASLQYKLVLKDAAGNLIWTVDNAPGASSPASIAALTNAGRLLGVQRFTANATYTPTAGTNSVIVEVQGGGGAGGGAISTGAGQVAAGSGGGAGGYARSRLTSGFSGASVVVGGAGAGSVGANGASGGSSSFGALLSATGGSGGLAGAAGASSTVISGGATAGGVGASGNLFNAQGGAGGWQLYCTTPVSGAGGASQFGAGALSVFNATANGNSATSYGAGGSGSCLLASSGTSGTGGGGSAGIVIVWEYA